MEGPRAVSEDNTNAETSLQSTELLESLQLRADKLLSEFRAYQLYLRSRNLSKDVETRIFRRGVEAEHKNLGSFSPADTGLELDTSSGVVTKDHESKRLQALRSSNLPFYEAVWASAKRCRGVRALGRRLYWDSVKTSANMDHLSTDASSPKPRQKKSRSALVDIAADDGAEWIKVSIVTAKRLIFEMAKEGWEGYGGGSDEDGSEGEDGGFEGTPSFSKGKLEVVKLAEDLRDASRATRIKYRHPQVRFILPRILEGEDKAIDAVLADIRATGAVVVCGEHVNGSCALEAALSETIEHMLPSPSHPQLTPTLNIDCTILLALISDISHVSRNDLPPSPSNSSGTYHTAILKQVESEEHAPLLPNELYPVMHGRKLVCTGLAAKRMREIVETMGTTTERARAEILLGEGAYALESSRELCKAWQGLSCHQLPNDIRNPIVVEDFAFSAGHDASYVTEQDDAAMDGERDTRTPATPVSHVGQLPSIVRRLTKVYNLSPINASVFIYGWINDIVTVTSNKVVAVGIERTLNQILDEDEHRTNVVAAHSEDQGQRDVIKSEFVGPKMYVCETARSLIGKEKVDGLRP